MVRPGPTFGCHFLLYKHGPAFNHSSHGVFVTVSSSNTPQTNDVTPKCTFCDSSTGTPKKGQCCSLGYELSVAQVCALSRSLGSSKKTLVLCNINACQRVSAENFDTSNFEITEQNLSRWIPGNPVWLCGSFVFYFWFSFFSESLKFFDAFFLMTLWGSWYKLYEAVFVFHSFWGGSNEKLHSWEVLRSSLSIVLLFLSLVTLPKFINTTETLSSAWKTAQIISNAN